MLLFIAFFVLFGVSSLLRIEPLVDSKILVWNFSEFEPKTKDSTLY